MRLGEEMVSWEEKGINLFSVKPTETLKKLKRFHQEYIDEHKQIARKQTEAIVSSGEVPASFLRLLSYFVKPRTLYSILSPGWNLAWETMLGEQPKAVLDQFIAKGYLREATPKEKTELNLTVAQLKELLRRNGEKPTGKKEDLLEQVINKVNIETISSLWQYNDVYVCSEKGLLIANKYLDEEQTEKQKAFDESIEQLKRGDLSGASKTFVKFYSRYKYPDPAPVSIGYNISTTPMAESVERSLRAIVGEQASREFEEDAVLMELARELWSPYRSELPKLFGSYDILIKKTRRIDTPENQKAGFYKGLHYTDYVEMINQHKREGQYEKALEDILGCISVIEKEESFIPPWYYKQAAIVYRKLKRKDMAEKYDYKYERIVLSNQEEHERRVEELPEEERNRWYPDGYPENQEVKRLRNKGIIDI